MDELEISALKRAFAAGGLYWGFDNQQVMKVVRIGPPPPVAPEDEPEPSEVAYLQNGTYVALWNAEANQFVRMKPVALEEAPASAPDISVKTAECTVEALVLALQSLKDITGCLGPIVAEAQGTLVDFLLIFLRDNAPIPQPIFNVLMQEPA